MCIHPWIPDSKWSHELQVLEVHEDIPFWTDTIHRMNAVVGSKDQMGDVVESKPVCQSVNVDILTRPYLSKNRLRTFLNTAFDLGKLVDGRSLIKRRCQPSFGTMLLIRLRRKHRTHLIAYKVIKIVAFSPSLGCSVNFPGGFQRRHRDFVGGYAHNWAVLLVPFENLVVSAI